MECRKSDLKVHGGIDAELPLVSNQLKNDAHVLIPCVMQGSTLFNFILLNKDVISKCVLYLI